MSRNRPPQPTRRSLPSVGDGKRQTQLLSAIARRTGNAVIVTDRQGRVEWVNEGCERLTGYSRDAIIGRQPGSLLQGPDTCPEARAHMRRAVAEGQPFECVVLNYTASGSQYWVRIESEPTLDDHGRVNGFIAIETDVTEARIAEERERVIKQVGERILGCSSVEHAAEIVAEEFVATGDIRAAQIWIVEPGSPTLRYLAGRGADASLDEWLMVGETTTFRPGDAPVVGVGVPGTVWGTAETCVLTDLMRRDRNGEFSRRMQAARLGRIRTMCAVPVFGPTGVIAVIEIGGSHRYPGYDRLPSLVEQVGRQFGGFMVQLLNRRAFESLFQHSPDALLVVDHRGAVVQANERANELFAISGTPSLETLLGGAVDFFGPEAEPGGLHKCAATTVDGRTFSAEVTMSPMTAVGGSRGILAVRDLTERHRQEAMLRQSLQEKVILVQEVHHRVKNNLQIISSLLSLQAAEVDSAAVRAAFEDTTRRIQSMAHVHQQLYASDNLVSIAFDSYARDLCNGIQVSIGGANRLEFRGDELSLMIDQAIPAGLILNELVTNAFKYGCGDDGVAVVHVHVRRHAHGWSMVVADEGPGIQQHGVSRRGSLGQSLIKALTRQLGGTRSDGTTLSKELGISTKVGSLICIEVPTSE